MTQLSIKTYRVNHQQSLLFIFSGLLELSGHLIELVITSVTEPFGKNLEQFGLSILLFYGEIHQ